MTKEQIRKEIYQLIANELRGPVPKKLCNKIKVLILQHDSSKPKEIPPKPIIQPKKADKPKFKPEPRRIETTFWRDF